MGNAPAQDANLHLLRDALNLRLSGPATSQISLRLDANYLTLQQDYNDARAEISILPERTRSANNVVGGGAVMEVEFNRKNRSTE